MTTDRQPDWFHISIIGNVGTGKSTLAELIQERRPCTLYLEEPDDYPFVRLFHESPYVWGFANLLNFIMTKFAQQAQIRHYKQCAVQEMNAIAIHSIWLPASLEIGHISQEEMAIIERVYEQLVVTPVSTPDLRIILQAPVETLIERIQKRGRSFEELNPKFVQLLTILDNNIAQLTQAVSGNAMIIDTETVDFTQPSPTRDVLLDDIVRQVPLEIESSE
jgi:deoxyadenosine/deoxycytidine kinase